MNGRAGRVRSQFLIVVWLFAALLTAGCWLETVAAEAPEEAQAPLLPHGDDAASDSPRDRSPSVAQYFYMVGYLHELNQRFSEAQMAYRGALEYDPHSPVLLTSLISVLARGGEVRSAISLGEQALQAHPQFADLRMLLGNLYSTVRERQAAIAQFEEAIRLDPTLEDAYLSLGTLYEEERDYPAARALLETLLSRHPTSFMGYFQLARVLVDVKDYAAAAEMLHKALALNPDFDRAWITLGGI
jgi:tetratricopeptide (TPR) repeat protein